MAAVRNVVVGDRAFPISRAPVWWMMALGLHDDTPRCNRVEGCTALLVSEPLRVATQSPATRERWGG
jgi:hypothetical protein